MESDSQRILDTVKHIRKERVLAAVNEAMGEGMEIACSLMVPFPGTYFRDHAEELGLTILAETWADYDAKHVVMETRNLSAGEIQAAVEVIVCDLGLRKTLE